MNTQESQMQAYAESLSVPTNLNDLTLEERNCSKERRPLQEDDIIVVLPMRLAIGSFGGSLSGISAPELGTRVVSEILERTGVHDIYDEVDTVFAGQVIQTGSGMNTARQIGINSGINETATGITINMACGSGLETVIMAAEKIKAKGNSVKVAIAGGVENMSDLPHHVKIGRKAVGLGHLTLVDGVLDGLTDAFSGKHMGLTAENIAEKYGVTREAADLYALRSQKLAALALSQDYFKNTIVPIEVKHGRETDLFVIDEYVKGETTKESLAKLRPAFKKDGGIVTAGNASGINDGAALMIVTTAGKAGELGLEPSMRLVSYGEAGVAPEVMGLGPIPASRIALEEAGLKMSDMDIAEINEAFGVVPLVAGKELGATKEQLNPLGGAIAHGHPLGATGAILMTKVAAYFEHNPFSRYGLVSLCIGGGQGIAVVLEKI